MSTPVGDCIEHQGSFTRAGYGQVRRGGKTLGAHRAAWEDVNGKIPGGLFVLHSCHNRRCVNVKHLRLGTNQDNMNDLRTCGHAKGKHLGESHGMHKLTEENVRAIKLALQAGDTMKSFAERYGVSHPAIRSIKIGRTWSHIAV